MAVISLGPFLRLLSLEILSGMHSIFFRLFFKPANCLLALLNSKKQSVEDVAAILCYPPRTPRGIYRPGPISQPLRCHLTLCWLFSEVSWLALSSVQIRRSSSSHWLMGWFHLKILLHARMIWFNLFFSLSLYPNSPMSWALVAQWKWHVALSSVLSGILSSVPLLLFCKS